MRDNKIRVKPQVDRLMNLLSLIEDGKFKIPTFQRDFIWEDKAKIDLFDSISKEYPIGSILLWRPNEIYANNYNIGPYTIDSFDNVDFYYILDGFQRLSTLFGCLTNPKKTQLFCDENLRLKKFFMVYDLKDEAFLMKRQLNYENTCIPVYKLIDTYEFLDFVDQLRSELENDTDVNLYIERAKKLSSTIIDYQIPSIEVIGGRIADAVDIFSRVNSKGNDISPDWMLSALTSDESGEGFNLGDIFSGLLDDLKEYNFDKIERKVLVQCIQNSFGKVYFDYTIEELARRSDFQKVSREVIESIKRAVKFLFEELLVIDKKLLPYSNQLVFLTNFFNQVKEPNEMQIRQLKKWFWVTTYSNYFTVYSLSKIREAHKQFNLFIQDVNTNPVYYHNAEQKFSTADLPKTVSAGSVRSKALQLFLLNWSNEFKSVESYKIESYKILYIYKNDRSHAGLIPFVNHTKDKDIKHIFHYDKSIGLSEIFNNNDFKQYWGLVFINEEIKRLNEDNSQSLALKSRLKFIEVEEHKFVEELNVIYQKIT